MYDRSGRAFTMLATILSCSISAFVFPFPLAGGVGGVMKATDFGGVAFGFEAGANVGIGAAASFDGTAGAVSKNEKSADAQGS